MEDPETTYQSIRRAAEVHRQVRAHARKTIKPGMSMLEIADLIEDGTRALVEEDTSGMLQSGVGFPTGLSLNHCAAHYTPNAGDKTSKHVIVLLVWSDCDMFRLSFAKWRCPQGGYWRSCEGPHL